MKGRALLLAVAVTAGAVFLPGAAAAPTPDLTPLVSQSISAGVHYTKYHWRHSTAAIYVAQVMNKSDASFKVMSAHNLIAGGRETVSSMCARTAGCIAAVNGDFWDVTHPSAAVLGGVVVGGEMWRSPNRTGQQVSVAPPQLGLTWSGELTDKDGTTLKLAGVNTDPVPNATVLYTPRYGEEIGARGNTAFTAVAPAQLLGRLGRKTPVSALRSGARGAWVRSGQAGFVASGPAVTELRKLFRVAGVTLTLSASEPTTENIGYHPVIMRDGKLIRTDPRDPMLTNPNPRTLFAWSATKTWLVAADGRESGGAGLTVGDVVALVRDLGATNAVLLDGGGSTTFDAGGRVLNDPSDGRERPVSNALAVVVPVSPHKVAAAPRHAALPPRVASSHAPRPAPAAKPAKPAAHTKPAIRHTAGIHSSPAPAATVTPHPSVKPTPVARAALSKLPAARPTTRAGQAPTRVARQPVRQVVALSPAAAEQVPGRAEWYYDWHAVALIILFLIAVGALLVFVRHELRRPDTGAA